MLPLKINYNMSIRFGRENSSFIFFNDLIFLVIFTCEISPAMWLCYKNKLHLSDCSQIAYANAQNYMTTFWFFISPSRMQVFHMTLMIFGSCFTSYPALCFFLRAFLLTNIFEFHKRAPKLIRHTRNNFLLN